MISSIIPKCFKTKLYNIYLNISLLLLIYYICCSYSVNKIKNMLYCKFEIHKQRNRYIIKESLLIQCFKPLKLAFT